MELPEYIPLRSKTKTKMEFPDDRIWLPKTRTTTKFPDDILLLRTTKASKKVPDDILVLAKTKTTNKFPDDILLLSKTKATNKFPDDILVLSKTRATNKFPKNILLLPEPKATTNSPENIPLFPETEVIAKRQRLCAEPFSCTVEHSCHAPSVPHVYIPLMCMQQGRNKTKSVQWTYIFVLKNTSVSGSQLCVLGMYFYVPASRPYQERSCVQSTACWYCKTLCRAARCPSCALISHGVCKNKLSERGVVFTQSLLM